MSVAPVLILYTASLMANVAQGTYTYASAAQIQLLYRSELDLVESLKTYLDSEQLRLQQLQRLLGVVTEDLKHISDGATSGDAKTNILDHPLHSYHMMKRFEVTWSTVNKTVFDNSSLTAFNATLSSVEPLWPEAADLLGARCALVRLQTIYDLPVKDLLDGLVAGRQSQPLSQHDTLLIGLTAVNASMPDAAIEWLTAAMEHPRPDQVNQSQIHHALAKAYASKEEYGTAVKHIQRAVELDPHSHIYLTDIIVDKNPSLNMSVTPDYKKLCKTLINKDVASLSNASVNDSICVLERKKNVPFQRTKVEYLSRSPEVVIFHEFLSDREALLLQQTAINQEMERAGTADGIRFSEYRVGKVAWLSADSNHLVSRIGHRIADVTGLDTKFAEDLQMSNYGLGGHYSIHHDSFGSYVELDNITRIQMHGDRIATLMFYLTDVEAGGATVFPIANIGVRPIKNSAIFWYNYGPNYVDKTMMHGGCPVLIGEKWVANKWFREFGQEFKRPCVPA